VVEVGCPAEHETFADFDLELPTDHRRPERDFGGQRFVRHVATQATWEPWRLAGFEQRNSGIGDATHGLAGVRVVRPIGPGATPSIAHDGELQLWFVLHGTVELVTDAGSEQLRAGSCASVPAGLGHALRGWSDDLELLEVTLPERLGRPAAPA
jgi:mannose-6-phosphate isomerase-like protein (cupin superfamily)